MLIAKIGRNERTREFGLLIEISASTKAAVIVSSVKCRVSQRHRRSLNTQHHNARAKFIYTFCLEMEELFTAFIQQRTVLLMKTGKARSRSCALKEVFIQQLIYSYIIY